MNFSLKPHQLVAHWVPGFVALVIVFIADLKGFNHLNQLGKAIGTSSTVLAVAVISFATGQFFDAIRNLIEELISRFFPKYAINWEFIWTFKSDQLERMDDYYFTYCVFDFNLAWALVVSALVTLYSPVFPKHLPSWMFAAILVAIVVFALDGCCLRSDIVELSKGLPGSK